MDSWTDGKTDQLTNRQTGEQIEKQTDEQPKTFMNRQTEWLIQTERQMDWRVDQQVNS